MLGHTPTCFNNCDDLQKRKMSIETIYAWKVPNHIELSVAWSCASNFGAITHKQNHWHCNKCPTLTNVQCKLTSWVILILFCCAWKRKRHSTAILSACHDVIYDKGHFFTSCQTSNLTWGRRRQATKVSFTVAAMLDNNDSSWTSWVWKSWYLPVVRSHLSSTWNLWNDCCMLIGIIIFIF